MTQKPGVQWPNVPYDEYAARIARARQCLADHQLDAMILFSPTNWWYYGGFTDAAQMHNAIWRTAMIVSQTHDPVVVADTNFVWTFMYTSWVEDVRYHSAAPNPTVRAFTAGDDFYRLLFDTVHSLDLGRGTIGLETGADISTYLSVDEYLRIRDALPDAKIVSADDAIFAQRMIKTPYEQAVIREGARRACLATRAAFDAIRPGVNEREVHRVFWRTAVELDLVESPYQGNWLCFSTNATETFFGQRWITGPVDRIIREGDFGNTDCGPSYKMYQFDFQRAFYVGTPSQDVLDWYEVGRQAMLETMAAVKPGVRVADLFDVSLRAVTKRGAPEHPISFIGHSEGLANHEPPWLVAGNPAVIQPGMVLALEVGAFRDGTAYGGAMPEELVLVTDSGVENLTGHMSNDLYIAR
jgi:Xaa-Pro aminopeptidase